MTRYIFLIGFFLLNIFFAQEKREKYDRLSISTLLLSREGVYKNELEKAYKNLRLPEKVNPHPLKPNIILMGEKSLDSILNDAARKMVALWFNRKENGEFSTDLISERGLYNATDLDILRTKMSQRGTAFLDENALEMIDLTYLVTFKFAKVRSWNDIYDEQDRERKKSMGKDFSPVERTRNGFFASAQVRYYQLDFSEEVQNYFYNSCWIYPEDNAEIRAEKIKNFETYSFPLMFLEEFVWDLRSDQKNQNFAFLPQLSEADLWNNLIQTAQDKAFTKMERKDAKFEVNTTIYKTKPIRAQIGTKESVYSDSRYFIYEKVEENGKIEEKRRAVVRAKHVMDNEKVATGDTTSSVFYQISGRKVLEGYVLRQRNDWGLGLSAGYMTGFSSDLSSGIGLSLDYNLGKIGKSKKSIHSFYLYLDVLLPVESISYAVNNPLDLTVKQASFNFYRFGGGFRKSFYFGRNFF